MLSLRHPFPVGARRLRGDDDWVTLIHFNLDNQ